MGNEDMGDIQAHVQHNGDPPFLWVVQIKHEEMDGGHFFTCDKIPGLLVGHRDKNVAIKQLPWVIQELMFRNRGVQCTVKLGAMCTDDAAQPDFAVIETKRAA